MQNSIKNITKVMDHEVETYTGTETTKLQLGP